VKIVDKHTVPKLIFTLDNIKICEISMHVMLHSFLYIYFLSNSAIDNYNN